MYAVFKRCGPKWQLSRLPRPPNGVFVGFVCPLVSVPASEEQLDTEEAAATSVEPPRARPGGALRSRSPSQQRQNNYSRSRNCLRRTPTLLREPFTPALGACSSRSDPFLANVPWSFVNKTKHFRSNDLLWNDVVTDDVFQRNYEGKPSTSIAAETEAGRAAELGPSFLHSTQARGDGSVTTNMWGSADVCDEQSVCEQLDEEDFDDLENDEEDSDDELSDNDDIEPLTCTPYTNTTTGVVYGYWTKCPYG